MAYIVDESSSAMPSRRPSGTTSSFRAASRSAEPRLRLVALEDERIKREAFKTLLPLFTLKAAAGYFGGGDAVEPEAWIEADGLGRLDELMFVARAVGRSMEPVIHDGDFVVFRRDPAGTRQGKTVLAQYRGLADPETGGSFTVKRYSSEKRSDRDTGWQHSNIVLSPLNRDFRPIIVPADRADDFKIVAEFIAVLGR